MTSPRASKPSPPARRWWMIRLLASARSIAAPGSYRPNRSSPIWPRRSRSTPGDGDSPVPLVDLKDVTVDLGGKTVVRDVSASIWPGELVGLIGPNGAGKSTLLRVILGLIQPTAGQVLFDGQPVWSGNRR